MYNVVHWGRPGVNTTMATTGREDEAVPGSAIQISRAQRTKEEGGYDCEFVKSPPAQLQHECAVCLLTLKEPFLTSCCGYSFCRVCIQRIESKALPCPLCNGLEFTIFPNKGLQRSLLAFEVYCQNMKYGCKWSGELGKLEQHLNVIQPTVPSSDIYRHGCAYVTLYCKYKCGEKIARKNLQEHEENCQQRPQKCKYCKSYESPYDQMYHHFASCSFYPVRCPNKCTDVSFQRHKLDQHLNEECPMIIEKCKNCQSEISRQNMPNHIKYCTFMADRISIGYELPDHFATHDDTSLDLEAKLSFEIEIEENLQEQIKKEKDESQQIRQEIDELESTCESQVSNLKSELQLKNQQIEDIQTKISSKESEIMELKNDTEKKRAKEGASARKVIEMMMEEHKQVLEKARETMVTSETKRLEIKLALERTKHTYEMKIKTLELILERKKTELAEKQTMAYKRESEINELKTTIAVEKERKEKEALMKTANKEIDDLKRSNAELERQLQSSRPTKAKNINHSYQL